MRLINANDLMELYSVLEDRGLVIPIDVVIQNIKDMPTAYDIDKVVEQLEKMHDEIPDDYWLTAIKVRECIEIVKGGVVQNG